jgi:hypothetical protein
MNGRGKRKQEPASGRGGRDSSAISGLITNSVGVYLLTLKIGKARKSRKTYPTGLTGRFNRSDQPE